MALKGRKPDMNTWHTACRYQGIGGISLGILLVLQGASNTSGALFRPRMPPIKVKGTETRPQIRKITIMVPKGRAAEELYTIATEFKKEKTPKKGTANKDAVSTRLAAHRPWPSVRRL